MKIQSLISALPMIAKFVGKKLGVQVVVGAGRARTDGQTIWLPALPDTEEARVLAHGYVDHEGAHVRYTDFKTPRPATPMGRNIYQPLEDVRIEGLLGQEFPGCRQNLYQLMGVLKEKGFFAKPAAGMPVPALVKAYVLYRLRADILGQDVLKNYADQAEGLLREKLPPGVMIKLGALAFEIRKARSTGDSVNLAERILTMFKEEADKCQNPPERGAGQDCQAHSAAGSPSSAAQPDPGQGGTGSDDGGSQPGQGQGRGGSDDGNPQPGEGRGGNRLKGGAHPDQDQGGNDSDKGSSQPSQGGGDSDNASPQLGQDQDGHGKGASGKGAGEILLQILEAGQAGLDPVSGDLGDILTQELNKLGAEAEQQNLGFVMAEEDPKPKGLKAEEAAAAARSATVALRWRLAGLIQASRLKEQCNSRRGRRVNERKLYRLRVGNPAMLVRRTRQTVTDTAVLILLDRSDSMKDQMVIANRAALATTIALEEIPGVAAAAVAFPGSRHDRVIPLVEFDERAIGAAGRFRLHAGGGTPMLEALWYAAWKVLLRPEERKIILIVTDGHPARKEMVKEMIQRCRVTGIEVMGLGIQAEAVVKALFGRDSANIDSIQELAPAMFKMLETRLAQQAA